MDYFSRLPLELFHLILSNCCPSTLLVCRQVCSLWQNVVSSSPHLHQHFRLRLIDAQVTCQLAANPRLRWLFQLKHRTFVCMGYNWCGGSDATLPYSSGVYSLTIDCCCRTISQCQRPRSCLLVHSWTDYTSLVEFNLVLYPSPERKTEASTWFYAGSLTDAPLRFDLPSCPRSVPEDVDTFPLLALPQIQRCVLVMDSIDPDYAGLSWENDYDANSWEGYNLNFANMYNMDLLVDRIAQLTAFTGWFWATDSQVIVDFESKLVQALAATTTDKRRLFTLYFVPARPVWPASCELSHMLPLICSLSAASVCRGCRYYTGLTRLRRAHYECVSEALIKSNTLINLKAGTRTNLAQSLKSHISSSF